MATPVGSGGTKAIWQKALTLRSAEGKRWECASWVCFAHNVPFVSKVCIYMYLYIYIRVIYFGTLHLKIGQPTPYSLREKRARFQSLFLEEHGLQLEFITSHEAPNFWYRGMWGGGGRLPGESAGPKAAAVPLSPAPGLRPFAPNVSVSWSA